MRGSLAALDRLAVACAKAVQQRQPQANADIAQLPVLSAPSVTDLVPVFHNGATYQATLSSLPGGQSGTATFSGTGSQTAFSIAHTLGYTPTAISVTPLSSAAAASFYVTPTSTALLVTFLSAPASGANNVSFSWSAR